jgi:aspartate kinase
MTEVFKFGGASVKNAEALRNVAFILKTSPKRMRSEEFQTELDAILNFHDSIVKELEINSELISGYESQKTQFIAATKEIPSETYDREYDKIIPFGELLSTSLLEAFLSSQNILSEWLDVRNIIKTNSTHRCADVDWEQSAIHAKVLKEHLYEEKTFQIVTQGFIGMNESGHTTTLGREGSDYSAAILAYLVDAKDVTIWKDVPGMLNADPKWFNNTVKVDQISYREAIELSYYGASVIHPKTIQPLQNKKIPLFIRSFLDVNTQGTVIQESMVNDDLVPMYIFKPNQILVSISSKDFSFIIEENLGEIFRLIAQSGLHVNIMQNSAISFSICVDNDEEKLSRCRELLSNNYNVRFNLDLELLTIRHYTTQTVSSLTEGKETLLEQRSRQTIRMVLRPSK